MPRFFWSPMYRLLDEMASCERRAQEGKKPLSAQAIHSSSGTMMGPLPGVPSGTTSSRMNARSRDKRSTGSSLTSLRSLGINVVVGLVCLYVGVQLGLQAQPSSLSQTSEAATKCPPCLAEPVVCPKQVCPVCSEPKCPDNNNEMISPSKEGNHDHQTAVFSGSTVFPDSVSKLFVNFSTVHREAFNDYLEIGVPLDDTAEGAEDVTIFYSSSRSMPQGLDQLNTISPAKALENCGIVKVILTRPDHRQCLAVMPQWESFNIYKFMRVGDKIPLNHNNPLRYVPRSMNDKGVASRPPDYREHIKSSYVIMLEYLNAIDAALAELKPIIEHMIQSSANPKSKTVVVQVCNYGQLELFANFMCSSKARGLDTSKILMFATDEETYELSKQLGIPAYYSEAIFGRMPKGAARGYGDRTFTKMMMAKVYCVHMVLSLGYNVLFQDVDVVWYRDPLPYLESPQFKEWDLMFQDDGARSHRYAPYSPNTGFYFVRYSAETIFLFDMLLRSVDNIARMASHQAALTVLLNHHATWRGLRVKVWKKGDTNPFPGGVEYHRNHDLMKRIIQRKAEPQPYIFHMSWTTNKDNKDKFFKQMGEWYLKENCLNGWDCCLAEPNVTCYYRDKPSIIPCKHMNPIDKDQPSFW
eukprot:Nitzschia sp. Nitz4//scaffold111_size72815//50782//52795//NITZ4_005796-RA/size72815-augustus-gene-0.15-mRNA-1//1//CDS//3329533198//2166//frame0